MEPGEQVREEGEARFPEVCTSDPCEEWAVLEALPAACYVATTDRRLLFVNARGRRLVKVGEGLACFEAVARRTSPCPWCILSTGPTGPIQEGNTSFHTFEREGKVFEMLSTPVPGPGGKVSCVTGIVREATEPGQAEARILASESRYRELFNSVRQGIFVLTSRGEIADCNRALIEIFRYENRKELQSIDPGIDLFAEPNDLLRVLSAMERDGAIRQVEVDLRRKDGSPVSVAMSGRVLRAPDGAVTGYEILCTDVTDRKELERELQQQASFLANVIEASVDGIICSDLAGEVLLYNRGAESILGYAEEEVVGKMRASALYPPGMAREIMRMIRSPEHGGMGRVDGLLIETKRKDGSVVRCNLSAAIVHDEAGAEAGTVAVLVDLTDRLTMEDRLRDARDNLLRSEKLAAMGRLTSQIAHEINNPLYGIMNTLELLRPLAEPGSRRRRLLEIAVDEGRRLADLLRKMMILSKPEQEPRQPTDLNVLLGDLMLFVERQMRVHSVEVVSALDETLPEIMASPAQLRQVFLNILQNAREAMPTGGTLTVRTARVGETVEARISDTGVGIREEHLHRIFEAFFTTKGKMKGVGLGLSVCYTAIRDHGGDIRVESAEGKGTTFVVVLPLGGGPEPQA